VYPETVWHRNAGQFGISLHDDYITNAVTYPISPLKPIRLWRPFPFSYSLMGKEAPQVRFQDIAQAFTDFAKRVWNKPEHGGLGIPNVQDYAIVLARHFGCDPVQFSKQCLRYMVTWDLDSMTDLLGICRPERPSSPSRQRRVANAGH